MPVRKIHIMVFLLIANVVIGQTVAGYQFENYKAAGPRKFSKAKIDFKSNATARNYKTEISRDYAASKRADFAGCYIISLWGCGTGCMRGAMVDVRDGKVYDLPLDETNYHAGCIIEDENDDCCLVYASDSKLFISQVCLQSVHDEKNDLQRKEFFIYLWNETDKRFEFVESKKLEKMVRAEP